MASDPRLLFASEYCSCPCHDTTEANQAEGAQRQGHPWGRVVRDGRGANAVPLVPGQHNHDPAAPFGCPVCLAAASACTKCLDHHVGALVNPVPELARGFRVLLVRTTDDRGLAAVSASTALTPYEPPAQNMDVTDGGDGDGD